MNTQLATMIIGFLGVIFTIITLNNQLRNKFRAEIKDLKKEIKEDMKTLDAKIDKVEKDLKEEIRGNKEEIKGNKEEIKALNSKLDTFLLAIFKGNLPKDDKDVA